MGRKFEKIIAVLDKKESSFFLHHGSAMVKWFTKMVEESNEKHDSSKEKK